MGINDDILMVKTVIFIKNALLQTHSTKQEKQAHLEMQV